MLPRAARFLAWAGLAALSAAGGDAFPAPAANSLGAIDFELANGMRFVVIPRRGMPTVEAGWVVSVGSADEPPGATGRSHLLEHMMFKGTTTIGSLEAERERSLLAELDGVVRELEAAPSHRGGRRAERRTAELLTARERLEDQAEALADLGAFSLEYSRQGATRINANTAEDLTLYYVTVPAERIELWFWLESDRLLDPVFRELRKEKRILAEERRSRIEATPTGAADLLTAERFWAGTPYGRSTLGEAADVERTSSEELADFFREHYGAHRLTAVLVGAVDPARVRSLAERYFSRLPRGGSRPEAIPAPAGREAETRIEIDCACPSQVRILYPTVPFGHPDQYRLQGLAGLLNGRAGRLHRNLVLQEGVAFAAFAQQRALRRAGSFQVTLELRGDRSLEALVAAWDGQLERIVNEAPAADEWMRTRRRLTTAHLDSLKDPHTLMRRLLVYAGLGDWRRLSAWPLRIAEVEPEELSAVARRYLKPEARLVSFYRETSKGPW